MQHKDLEKTLIDLKADDKGSGGTITGYGNVFNVVDRAKELTLPGAFAESIKAFNRGEREIPLLDAHQMYGGTSAVIGKITSLKEDKYGLLFTAALSSTALSQEIRTKVREGLLKSLSIGYRIVLDQLRTDGVRLLKTLDLREISVVIFPANEQSTITGVKNLALSQAKISAAQANQAGQDLEYLEMRAKELRQKEKQLAMLEQLAAQQHAEELTPTQCGWIV